METTFPSRFGTRIVPLGVIVFLCLGMANLMADGTNAAPVKPSAPAAGEDFGQYLVDHQAELAPFFNKNNDQFLKVGIPILLGLFTRILVLTLLAGWALDVFLSRVFSAFFAPTYAKIKRALIYASGRLVLSMGLSLLLGLGIALSSGADNLETVILTMAGVYAAVGLGLQIAWVNYLYRTGILMSGVFYVAIMIVHGVVGVLVSAPLLGAHATDTVTAFVDQVITVKLQGEIASTKHDLDTATAARDEAQAKVDAAQGRIAQARTDLENLQKDIEEKKNSEVYLFSQIVKLHAQGNLAAAHDQFTDFLTKFPNGAMKDAATTQLTEVNSEIATQEAQKKAADAAALLEEEKERADLLDRAAKGTVTLSEMRDALLGKTLQQVKELFGLPAEVASDRWGYSQQMIFDPLMNRRTGLAVYFSDGKVQGVDYYYGK